jgi:hypothetical protein
MSAAPATPTLADARAAEANGLLATLGLSQWEDVLKAAKVHSVLRFVDYAPSGLLSKRPADLSDPEKAEASDYLKELRKHDKARPKALPADEGDALSELREIARAYEGGLEDAKRLASLLSPRTHVPAPPTPGSGLGAGMGAGLPPPAAPSLKFTAAVRDGLYANLALANGHVEMDDADKPLETAVAAVWEAAAANPPRTLAYGKVGWGRDKDGVILFRKKKDGSFDGDPPSREMQLVEFNACLDTLALAHSFRTDGPEFAHYEAAATDEDKFAEDARGKAVHIGGRLATLRTLGLRVHSLLATEGRDLSDRAVARYLTGVYDSLMRHRNTARAPLSGVTRRLLDSGDLYPQPPRRSSRKGDRGGESSSSDDSSGSSDSSSDEEDSPPKKKKRKRGGSKKKPVASKKKQSGGQASTGTCHPWYYLGGCAKGSACKFSATHTKARKGKGKAQA